MISQLEIVSRLVLAAALGSVIGIERERLSWAAGLRTHMLVCVGATLVMIVSAFGFSDILGMPNVTLDPSRVAAQVVSGIGFLGAGSILLRGEIVRGLTTAASVWVVAGVGLAVGGGMYTAAIAATAIVLLILAGLKPLERRYFTARRNCAVRLMAVRGSVKLTTLEHTLGMGAGRIVRFIVDHDDTKPDVDQIQIAFSHMSDHEFGAIRTRLRQLSGVRDLHDLAP